MIDFFHIGATPVMPASLAAAIAGVPMEQFVREFLAFPEFSGVWDMNGIPSLEYDDLWAFTEVNYPDAFKVIFT